MTTPPAPTNRKVVGAFPERFPAIGTEVQRLVRSRPISQAVKTNKTIAKMKVIGFGFAS
jgi:hypothetical protein